MSALGAVICHAIAHHYGRHEFLRRLETLERAKGIEPSTLSLGS
jgi:hypothetical protein